MKLRNVILSILLLAALLLAQTAVGQVDYSTATLRGTVTDPNGAVVAGATVTATNTSTGIVKVARTTADGGYRFAALPPGTYQITTEAKGFSKESFKGLELTVGQSATYDVHLKVGSASETVEVSAENVPLIQADQSQQANTINYLQVKELPNINRSFTNDVYTLPGVSNSDSTRAQNPGFTGYLTTGFSIGGSNGRNNLSTIDGGENEYGTGQYRVTNLPVDAIQEYQVNRNAYAAEFGFTDGSAINIVTRSGGKQWHGDAFGYFRNQSTEASNFFNSGPSKAFSQNAYMGGSLGGPVVKDKIFFFGAYEYQKLDTPFFNPIINSSEALGIGTPGLGANCAAQFASHAPDQLCYVNALKASGNPFLIGFANGITPGLSPLNNAALKKILTRDDGVFNAPDRLSNAIARFDYQRSEKNSFNLRLGYVHNDFHSAIAGITNSTPDGNGLFVRDFSILGTWNHTVSQNLLNQVLVQVVPRNRSSALPNSDNGINFSLGDLGAPGLGGTSTFGESSLIPYKAYQQRYQFEDDITWSHGKHTFKFGASYRPANYHVEDDLWFNSQFDFKDGLLGLIFLAPPAVQAQLVGFNLSNGLPALGPATTNLSAAQSFAFGLPVDVVAGFNNPKWQGWGHYFGSYLQDSWKVSSRLTVNGGVRLDFDGEPSPLGTNFYASPRLGFAWDPFGDNKTILRAGAGIYVAPVDVLIPSYGSLLDGSGRYINEVLQVLSQTDPRVAQLWGLGLATGKLPFGHLTAADFAAVGINTTTPGASVGYSVVPNYKNPYSFQASMSIDRQLARNLSLELGYNMYHAVHLQMPVETAYARIPVGSPLCPTAACTDQTGGPLYAPTTGQFQHTAYASNGSSIYHGLTASLTKRYSHGLQFQANYTWSKTIDDTIDFASFQNWFRPDMLGSFRGVSVFDIPHIFTANAVYTTPFKTGQGNWVRNMLADISLSPIVTLRSGLPFSVRLPNTTNKINGQTLDSNYAIPFLSSRDNNRGAGYATWDMNLQKAIYINRDRGVRLNLIVQATNLLNRTNFNHINDAFDINGIPANGVVQTADGPLNLITGPFTGLHGKVPTDPSQLTQPLFYSKADSPRQVQFGLRLAF
ncbi:MAG: carboxypeptidase regulatory-like domain-containing protein [Acidobacteriia bacterium]|nr:carboxypeptidase regulatory-like domain-containing protein [Terriglobia bacterium]